MAVCVGVDLVAIGEVERSIAAHGERYLTRVYTEQELIDSGGDPKRLAARFAVKEATMKALGRGGEGLGWHSISVTRGPSGRFAVELRENALRLAQQQQIESIAVSMTHERDHAAAVVVMEARV